ncbi:MAG: ATP-binding protein [Desulfobacterota bacterium]|jgi:signal transduction histidine kinase|nr:ATP-binding protein [Thermodesulfobacteriota bacterium]
MFSRLKEIPIRWVIVLVIALALFFLTLTLFLGLRSVQLVTRLGENLFNQYQLTLARKIADDIQNKVLEYEHGLLEMKQLISGQEKKAAANLALLALFSHLRNQGIAEFQAMDPEGRSLFELGLAETPPERIQRVLKETRAQKGGDRIFISAPFRLPDQTDPNLYIVMATAAYRADGSYGGACFLRLAANMIALQASMNIVSGQTGYVWIVDEQGIFLAHHDLTFVGRSSFEARRERNPRFTYQTIDRLTRERLLKGEEGTATYETGWHRDTVGRITKLIAYTPVRFLDQPKSVSFPPSFSPLFWSVAVVSPETEVSGLLGTVSKQQWGSAGLLVLIILLSALGAIFLALHWSSTLQEEVKRKTAALEAAQKKLLHAERLTAVGQGVVRVSHEIKNPLMVIGGFARQVARKIQGDEASVKKLDLIVTEVQRLEKLLTEVRDFTRVREPVLQQEDINRVVRQVIELMEPALTAASIRLTLELAPDPGPCRFDPDQIKQVLINLVKNAVEAMPQGGGITLRTRGDTRCIFVEVEDTGPGIPQEHLSEIFNAFFTTKEKGTGLGLAVSLKILNDHNGELLVSSREGEGSVFSIRLPRQA